MIEKERRYLIQEFLKMGLVRISVRSGLYYIPTAAGKDRIFIKGAAVRGENTDSLLCKLQEYAAGLLPHCGKTACR